MSSILIVGGDVPPTFSEQIISADKRYEVELTYASREILWNMCLTDRKATYTVQLVWSLAMLPALLSSLDVLLSWPQAGVFASEFMGGNSVVQRCPDADHYELAIENSEQLFVKAFRFSRSEAVEILRSLARLETHTGEPLTSGLRNI